MQWMEPKAASIRVKHRIGYKMIQVNQHGEQENEVDPEPFFPIDEEGNEYRKSKMKKIVDELLHAAANVLLFAGRDGAPALWAPGLSGWADRLTGRLQTGL